MIKTKSILAKESVDDGTRICVMRWVRGFYKYDKWIKDLAPSPALLKSYMKYKNWDLFEPSYKCEMKDKQSLIRDLKERSDGGEIITLLCWEKTDDCCHRRLLKELIENYCNV